MKIHEVWHETEQDNQCIIKGWQDRKDSIAQTLRTY